MSERISETSAPVNFRGLVASLSSCRVCMLFFESKCTFLISCSPFDDCFISLLVELVLSSLFCRLLLLFLFWWWLLCTQVFSIHQLYGLCSCSMHKFCHSNSWYVLWNGLDELDQNYVDYLGHHVLLGDNLILCDLVFGNRCISVRSDNLEGCELECDSASSISHFGDFQQS